MSFSVVPGIYITLDLAPLFDPHSIIAVFLGRCCMSLVGSLPFASKNEFEWDIELLQIR